MDMTHGTIRLNLGAAAAALALALCLAPAVALAQAVDDFERGRQLLAQGDAKGASVAFKRVAESRKTDADAWYQLGLALCRANKQKDARKAFERAVELRDSAHARTGLAFTLLLLGKTADAEREAKRALALDPRLAHAHYVLAAAHFREDRMEEAALKAEEALRLDPNSAAAARLSGEALLNIYGVEYERAAERYPVSRDMSPEARRAALESRDEMVEPSKGRLRVAAERLWRFAESPPAGSQKEDLSELAETLEFYGKPRKKGDPPYAFRQADVTSKAVILSKPGPDYTPEAEANGTTGTVRLRAVLAADGRVRHIMVMRRLTDGLTEQAVAAARKIKFTPATLGGRRVSQYVILEYNFNVGVRLYEE